MQGTLQFHQNADLLTFVILLHLDAAFNILEFDHNGDGRFEIGTAVGDQFGQHGNVLRFLAQMANRLHANGRF